MEKENIINSKIGDSIQPFITIRESSIYESNAQRISRKTFKNDLRGPCSRSKGRKGISRVNSLEPAKKPSQTAEAIEQKVNCFKSKPEANISHSKLLSGNQTYSDLPSQHNEHFTTEPKMQLSSNSGMSFGPIATPNIPQNPHPHNIDPNAETHAPKTLNNPNAGSETSFVFTNKLNSMESMLTVLQQDNSEKEGVIKQLRAQVQEGQKQKKNLLVTVQQSEQSISKYMKKCRDYEAEIESKDTEIANLRIQLNKVSAESCQRPVSQIGQEVIELREKYRQLLIKSSMIEQQNSSLSSKTAYLMERLEPVQQANSHLSDKLETLRNLLAEQRQHLGSYKKIVEEELPELNNYKQEHQKLIQVIEQYELTIKEMNMKRIDQIEYHQEQLKRRKREEERILHENQTLKAEAVRIQQVSFRGNGVEIRAQLEQVKQELLKLKLEKEQTEHTNREQMRQIQQDYETIISQLRTQIDQLIHTHNKQNQHDEKSIAILEQQLMDLKDPRRSRLGSWSHDLKYDSSETMIQQQQQAEDLRDRSPENNIETYPKNYDSEAQLCKRLQNYEMQIQKLQDKIHIFKLQNEKQKDKQSNHQRKIKRLQQQIEHCQSVKQKLRDEKIINMEELQAMKRELLAKNKDNSNLSSTVESLKRLVEQRENQINVLDSEMRSAQQEIIRTKGYEDSYTILEQRHKANSARLTEFKDLVAHQEVQISQMKQYIEIISEENTILKKKNTVNESLIINEHREDGLQIHKRLYRNICVMLGVDFQHILPSQSYHKESQEEYQAQLISNLYAAIQSNEQKHNLVVKKLTSLQITYQQLVHSAEILKRSKQKEKQSPGPYGPLRHLCLKQLHSTLRHHSGPLYHYTLSHFIFGPLEPQRVNPFNYSFLH